MAYQQKRMNPPMPPLFEQILTQSRFQKAFDTKLETDARIKKKTAVIDDLKA